MKNSLKTFFFCTLFTSLASLTACDHSHDHDSHKHDSHNHDTHDHASHQEDHDTHNHETHHDSHDHSEHSQTAHEHGVAQMELVVSKQEVLIEVHSPLYNLLGFEHKPKLAEQKQVVQEQLTNIRQGKLITLNTEAQCAIKHIHAKHPFETTSEHQAHKGHKDIHFEYELSCDAPQHLTQLNSKTLFATWKNLQTLKVQWVVNDHQSAKTLNRDQMVIDLNHH